MENYKVERFESQVGEIPLVVFRPEGYAGKYKTIIHYHGWSSVVETYELFGAIFAHYGFQVVLPEVIKHGVRGEADNYESYLETFDVIVQSIEEYDGIKDFIINELGGDSNNLIISGHSMGGIISSAIFVRDLSLKAAIIYNSIINYEEFHDGIAGNIGLDERLMEVFRRYDPMDMLENFNDRNMLIFVGEEDSIIPVEVMLGFQDRLKENGIRDEKIVYSFHSDGAHSITYKMLDETLDYLLFMLSEE